ncbi:MAG: hypothetical protein FIA95_16005 [Gemmatimonadetes bacterium]|nr:hypothetical protein [Gemmatimonadota bacterium]
MEKPDKEELPEQNLDAVVGGVLGVTSGSLNTDLQNNLQQQQQGQQLLANVEKALYDTTQAIVRKIG